MSTSKQQKQNQRRTAKSKMQEKVMDDEESSDECDSIPSDECNSFGATGEWEDESQRSQMLTLEMKLHTSS